MSLDDDAIRAAVDPCPFASQLAGIHAWQHGAHAVRCAFGSGQGCGRIGLRFAWWMGDGHACGACHDRARVEGRCPACL